MQQVSCYNPLWALPIFMYVTSLSYYWLHLSNISCINLKRYCMLGSWHTLTRWDWTVITKNMRSIAAPVAVIWARQKLSHWLWQPIRTLSILGGHVASAIVLLCGGWPTGLPLCQPMEPIIWIRVSQSTEGSFFAIVILPTVLHHEFFPAYVDRCKSYWTVTSPWHIGKRLHCLAGSLLNDRTINWACSCGHLHESRLKKQAKTPSGPLSIGYVCLYRIQMLLMPINTMTSMHMPSHTTNVCVKKKNAVQAIRVQVSTE